LNIFIVANAQVKMDQMKITHADSPFTKLNIYVPGGLDFDVKGFATFPHSLVNTSFESA
jgi:hypothetical protein